MLLSISQGRAPTSLFNVCYEQPVDIRAVGRLSRNYEAPKPAEGTSRAKRGGVRLGNHSTSPNQRSAEPDTEKLRTPIKIKVNEAEPDTIVKIMLYEGTRFVVAQSWSDPRLTRFSIGWL